MGRYELVDDMSFHNSPHSMDITNAIEINRRATIIIRIFVSVSLSAISHRASLRAHVHHLEHARYIITTTRRAPLHYQVALVVTAAQHPQEFQGRPFGRR